MKYLILALALSAVLKILNEKFGCYIIESDKAGHLVMQNGMKAYGQIVREFGEDILDSERKIDRAKLAGIVFADREKLTQTLINFVEAGDTVLVKASHFMEFPKIVKALEEALEA